MVNKWEYGGHHHRLDMSGEISLPNNSMVKACDWLDDFPQFMLRADTLFVDPPWNIGNVNTFYTKADKGHVALDFVGFSKRLFARIDEISPRFLFLEMGKEYLSWHLEQCKQRYKYVTFYNSTYYRKKQNRCYVIHATDQFRRRRYSELEDMDEADIIAWICSYHEYDCIGDLCMGLGLVGRHAYAAGRSFVGTELNPKRLASLVAHILEAEQNDAK